MTRGSQHLRSLTSLRFFAAALVVLYHSAIQSSVDGTQPFAVLRFGYLGVTFFFVLSGFVLVWSSREGDRPGQFYRRRFARVWPLHALTLALAALLGAAALIDGRGPAWSVPVNGALLQAWLSDPEVIYGFNGVSWSLSAEAFFYAAFPALVLLGRRIGAPAMLTVGVAWLVLGGLVAETSGANWVAVAFPAYRIGEFAVGMGLAMLVRSGALRRRIPITAAVAVLIGSYGALVVINRLTAGELLTYRPWLVVLAILPGVGTMLLAFAQRDLGGHEGWMTSPALVRLGQWSFALYMVHELVLRAARPVMLEHRWAVPVAIAGAIAVAGMLFEWFERPVEKRLRGRGAPAVQLELVEK